MNEYVKDQLALLRRMFTETLREWREDNGAAVAAALAYYAIFSLSPLLIVVALVLGLVIGSNEAQVQVIDGVESTVGNSGADTVQQALDQTDSPQASSIPSLILWFGVIFWGVSGLFSQVQKALNIIWEVRLMPGVSPAVLVKNRLLSFSVVLVASSLLVISTVTNTALGQMDVGPVATVFLAITRFLITWVVMTLIFASVFKILPDVIIQWDDVLVGALFTAFLFLIGQSVVGLYINNTDVGSVYGAAGSLTIILVWVYYTAQIFLFGAEFTEVWAVHHGAQLRPDNDAVWVNPEKAAEEFERAREFRARHGMRDMNAGE